jgi:hypothetical protein
LIKAPYSLGESFPGNLIGFRGKRNFALKYKSERKKGLQKHEVKIRSCHNTMLLVYNLLIIEMKVKQSQKNSPKRGAGIPKFLPAPERGR